MKKCVKVLLALVLFVTLITNTRVDVEASGRMPMLDGSYLTQEDEAIGTAVAITRGEDLQSGYSKLLRLGPGRIYAGGTTIAEHTVASVQVTVVVECASAEDDEWTFVTAWHAENVNADSVNTSRQIEVEGDYYYRVRCTHSAGNDMSSSFTNGIWIEAP